MHFDRQRILVVVASYGERNLPLLRSIIAEYQAASFPVDIVVVSDAPKDLGAHVEVVVGLPGKDPWSLPFAHKAVMAHKVDCYDLFAYSEDDIVVRDENIQAFLRVTRRLAPDEIAGFLRYELDDAGNRYLPDVHAHYRWKPESVQRRGVCVIAELTNQHAGFYLLTREQLRKAIASGGFIRAPYCGRYDLACTASTDPYTSCGFRKVICISDLENFLIHHTSNRYASSTGLSFEDFQQQIQALFEIADLTRPAATLCPVEPKVNRFGSKSLYEKPRPELLNAVPADAQTILSIGCGWGAFEAELQERGVAVTALALDSVIGAVAERRGIEVIYGTLSEALRKVQSHQFDCVIMSNLFHLLPDVPSVLAACSRMLRPDGRLLLSGPNFDRLPILLKRMLRKGDYGKLRSFAESGINIYRPSSIAKMLLRHGFRVSRVRWLDHIALLGGGKPPAIKLGVLTAQNWTIESVRQKVSVLDLPDADLRNRVKDNSQQLQLVPVLQPAEPLVTASEKTQILA